MQVTRRNLLTGAGAAIAGAATATVPTFAAWEPSLRYPDPAIKILDPSFAKYRLGNAGVERLATGMRFGEGPVWFGDGRYLLMSDIPNDSIMRWDEETRRFSVFRRPSNKSNGLTRDRQGRLIVCEHGARRLTRTEYDGSITVLMDRFEGKQLNSPNDVVVKSDDSIWFTDPALGRQNNYTGYVDAPELPDHVYRLDRSGRAIVVAADINRPNGLAFSPDENKLYIVEYGVLPRSLRVYDVVDDGQKLANGRAFTTAEPDGAPDGFRVDIDGNLWCGWDAGEGLDGVMIFNPAGKRIGQIVLPELCANLCFGGLRRNRLFMAASHSLYSLYVNTQGAQGG